jgi:hypothetical protein
MQETEFQQKMSQLLGEIQTLPPDERQRLEQLAAETSRRHDGLRRTIGSLQENLDQLRLGVKYLIFDLEATRRENAQLRSQLHGHGGMPTP